MADRTHRNPLNPSGKYYNDLSCIDCDMCREIAPQIFVRDDEEGYTYTLRQPISEEEIALVQEAMVRCPTETIGDDG